MIGIKTYYIQKVDKPKKIVNKIRRAELEKQKFYIYSKLEKENDIKKIVKKMYQYDINNVVIEKKLYGNQKFIDYLNIYDVKIFDGRWIIKYLSFELLDYVIEKRKIKKQETEMAITANEITDSVIETIKILAKTYKRVTVVTNHINKLRKIEKQLYEQEGILIIISNNQKRSLLKPQIILNMDFNNEALNKYKINENGVIINLEGNVKIESKRFNGININDYEIEIEDKKIFEIENLEEFYIKDLLEARIYRKDSFLNIRKSIISYKPIIMDVYGTNGKIERFS